MTKKRKGIQTTVPEEAQAAEISSGYVLQRIKKLSIGALSDKDLKEEIISFERQPLKTPKEYLGEWLLYKEIDGERKAAESLEIIKDGRYIRMSRGPVGDNKNRTYFVCNYSFDDKGNLVLQVSGYLHGSGADAGDTGTDVFILHLVDKGHLQYKTSAGADYPDEIFEREEEEEETEPVTKEHTAHPFDEEDEEITGILPEVDDITMGNVQTATVPDP